MTQPRDNTEREDIVALLEEVINQNATLQESLDNALVNWAKAPVHEQKPTIVQAFKVVFSWETIFVLIVIAVLIILLFQSVLS